MANYTSTGTVSILLNNGNGTFPSTPSYTYTVGAYARSIVAGDFNGDGKLDLATANYYDSTVSVLLGTGSGTFQNATGSPCSVGVYPFSIVAGDFNGDGLLDLATANYGANNVSVLLNNANGTFNQTTYPTGSGPAAIVAGDFNGDGKLDLATANHGTTTVSVLGGNGDGTFQTNIDYNLGASPYALAAADIFDLGKLDLVTANFTANNVSVVVVQPWSSGNLNGALTLENINSQYVSVPSNSDFNFGTGLFTLSAWVRPAAFTASGANYTILARGQNTANYFEFGMSYGVNNGIFLTVGSGGTTMTLAPATNVSSLLGNGYWHLVTATRDASGNGTLYIDGASVGTLSGMNVINVSPVDSRNLGIGACLDQGANYKYFNGKLDDARVYSTALSSSEIAILAGMKNGVSIVASDPVAGVYDNTPDNTADDVGCYEFYTSLGGYVATETSGQGQLTLLRTGDASQPLTVYYSVGGSAAPGTDYQALSGQATFLAGHTTATITVQPLKNAFALNESVIVTLIPAAQYELASQSAADTATVAITSTAISGIASHLSADWTLNQNANDSSGNGLNGTPVNNPTWPTGGGVTLNGVNQYVSAPQVNLGTSAFTLSAWVKLDNSITTLDTGTLYVYPIICNGYSGAGFDGFDLEIASGCRWNGLWLRVGGDTKGNLPSFQMGSSADVARRC